MRASPGAHKAGAKLIDDNSAERIVKRLFSLDAYARARSVSCYLSMPAGEVKTDRIIKKRFGSGQGLVRAFR